MIVKSPYANKEFNLPDDKLPDAARFALKCPFTGKRIVFEKRDGEYVISAGETQGSHAPTQPGPREAAAPALKLPQVEPDIHPPGTKVAFLYLEGGWVGSATEFFKGKGYAVSTASDELEAIAKLRLNNYDVVVSECSGKSVRLRGEIGSWQGGKRRSVNFVLVGDQGQSNDLKVAFVEGANSFLALSDESQARDLLEGALAGYEMHYLLAESAKKQVEG